MGQWEEDKDVTALLCTVCSCEVFDAAPVTVVMCWGYSRSLRVLKTAVELGQAVEVESENHFAARFI